MSFSLDLTDEQTALRHKAHAFAQSVIRPVAGQYDRAQEFPWAVLEEAARDGLYGWELYAQLSMDPTGLSLPILMASSRSLNFVTVVAPGRLFHISTRRLLSRPISSARFSAVSKTPPSVSRAAFRVG